MPIVRIERRQGRSSVSGGPSILAELGSTMIDVEVGFESLPGTKSDPKREDLNPREVGSLDAHGE